jgi:hypothetical protein
LNPRPFTAVTAMVNPVEITLGLVYCDKTREGRNSVAEATEDF